jgi:hypothetical protein
MTFDAFDTVTIQTSRTSVFARWGGSGPPLLLLHGFPETHLMWRAVAPLLAVLDIVPTLDAWDLADARFAEGYWPWSLLAQPEPLPERLLAGAPDAVVDAAPGGWGSAQEAFDPAVRAAYVAALSDPGHVHAICEEYRARPRSGCTASWR